MRDRAATHFALAILLVVVTAGAAWATPSTLIWIPSTDVQAPRTWHLGSDSYFTARNTGQATVYDLGLEYGFANGRAEAGFDYISPNDSPLFFNAKYLLTAERARTPALVVGGYGFGTDRGVTDFNLLYVEGAKTRGAVRITLGYCRGKESTLGRDPDMLLAGVDGYLDRAKRWWGAVDYQSGKHAFGALNAGVAYYFAPNVSAILGYDWYNAPEIEDTLTVQLDVNF